MLSADVRRAIERAVAAAGLPPADPGLRPTGRPGQYASSVAFAVREQPRQAALRIAAQLTEPETQAKAIAHAEVTGQGFITITLASEALASLTGRVIAAGPGCATSDALRHETVPGAPAADPLTAPSWPQAQAALAARLTARLASAAGATPARSPHQEERTRPSPVPPLAAVIAWAGPDAVRFTLARAAPGRPLAIDQHAIARHAPDNPAYAVRYAHARAAAELRWARDQAPVAGNQARTLLDALAWLPERVAVAARRHRPDEFARYLEELARVTVDALTAPGDPGSQPGPGTDRLGLAEAARTGLAAGLGLLDISAPDRL